ncbi:hypothetical protein SAMN05421820_11415 [Pedobacter steynii]|uniref:Uncharacterized protein n=1 Tax=Pedobacter steynii TaxID=430522 RepID=A0A1H0IXK2_9SPHI|nr:hypothetical protein [Pedobacter steynii]NQX42970.1 hypothetical protein [Pedobacter steynii]SDO36165.1 hypothetical protein SAMN05421820_11415 [Pedobacter steynii]
MRNTIIIILIFCSLFCKAQKEVSIVAKFKALKTFVPYAFMPNDSIIRFQKRKYLVKTKAYLENGEFIGVDIWNPLGYVEHTKNELSKVTEVFYDAYEIDLAKIARILDDKHINIDGKTYRIRFFNKKRKEIYYFAGIDPEYLHIIRYQ